MSRRHSGRFLWFSLICIVLIIGGVVRFSAVEPLKVRSRVAAYGVPANQSTGVGAVSFKHYPLPYSFEVGRVNSLTMNDVLLHSTIAPGLVYNHGIIVEHEGLKRQVNMFYLVLGLLTAFTLLITAISPYVKQSTLEDSIR